MVDAPAPRASRRSCNSTRSQLYDCMQTGATEGVEKNWVSGFSRFFLSKLSATLQLVRGSVRAHGKTLGNARHVVTRSVNVGFTPSISEIVFMLTSTAIQVTRNSALVQPRPSRSYSRRNLDSIADRSPKKFMVTATRVAACAGFDEE